MTDKQKLAQFIQENFVVGLDEELQDDDSLLEKGIIDSTGVLELVAFLEETYKFKIKDEELIPENLDSIKNISKLILGKMQYELRPVESQDVVVQKGVQ